MTMFQRLSAVVALLSVNTSLAFSPTSNNKAWGVTTSPSSSSTITELRATNELVIDEDFTNVDLERLLGRRRINKLIRKYELFAQAEEEEGDEASAAPAASAPPAPAKKSPAKIIIAGAPASGKGTQCEMIKAKYGVVHLSTGDMLRAAVADQTEVGVKAKEFMDAGKLVPDEVIIGVVKDRLDQEDCKENGWLLDGFPRTPAQADALAQAGIKADCFLFLDVPDEILVERVVGRRTDPVTGKIYHMTFSPPDDEEVAARLEQRSDDTEEKVKVRLEQFHANVDAVKGSYTEIMVAVDGNQKPDEVASIIADAVDAKLA
eukprot:CAMPEP_0185725612 /NCGR_PEP_ID=MMETSP1171-20130828/1825_1 /TAXON_ID=374046 /ORGANISM="Helicotheca tamensis, Strain CCMP826" /LENGTH=318 /DNA_ID=CAMNT_0028393781 /DNA_START=59 /DNA_END=1015 /DNA_ORIENTATION=-